MRREERVTVQGPVKEQHNPTECHRGGAEGILPQGRFPTLHWCGISSAFLTSQVCVFWRKGTTVANQTQAVKFNALTLRHLSNDCWLLRCTVSPLGIALPFLYLCTQDLKGFPLIFGMGAECFPCRTPPPPRNRQTRKAEKRRVTCAPPPPPATRRPSRPRPQAALPRDPMCPATPHARPTPTGSAHHIPTGTAASPSGVCHRRVRGGGGVHSPAGLQTGQPRVDRASRAGGGGGASGWSFGALLAEPVWPAPRGSVEPPAPAPAPAHGPPAAHRQPTGSRSPTASATASGSCSTAPLGMPCTQCARSAKFWMSANTRTLVLAPFHKLLVPYQGFCGFPSSFVVLMWALLLCRASKQVTGILG